MRKTLIVIIVLVLAGAVAYRIYKRHERLQTIQHRERSIEEFVVPVEVYKVTRGNLSEKLFYSGIIKGKDEVQVYSPLPGKFLKYLVKEGDFVQKNQVIALVDRNIPGMEYKPIKVKSPIKGVASGLVIKRGNMIGPNTPVAVVTFYDTVEISLNLVEKDFYKIKKGAKVEVHVEGIDKIFTGKIVEKSSIIDPRTRMGWARVYIPNKDHALLPGMLAEVYVLTSEKENVLVIPSSATLYDALQDKYYVFVVKDGIAKKRFIETGLEGEDFTEVRNGLKKGETIVVKGQGLLRDGIRVKVVE